MENLQIEALFDLSHTIAASLFSGCRYPWEVLPQIHDYILALGKTLPPEKFDSPAEHVWIAKSASVAPSASITGPCIIDENAEVRHCAFIRGSAIVGKNAVVGNSTELKNAVLFDCVQVPHYNYVGDSVLGYRAHMGAGSITSNVKSDKTPVEIGNFGSRIVTGMKKIGAMLGDGAEIGCSSVLNPGTVIGRHSTVYPTSCVRGVVEENCIYKGANAIIPKTDRK
ncbi:MAG: UDP-N-acetylglucosamine pyrophosphorylase [Firmicutes bacterium]|nr:UDP-N-acetylglucosamine pyrophosphorylase [Bacillota bacterium]